MMPRVEPLETSQLDPLQISLLAVYSGQIGPNAANLIRRTPLSCPHDRRSPSLAGSDITVNDNNKTGNFPIFCMKINFVLDAVRGCGANN